MENIVAKPEMPDWYDLLAEAVQEPGHLAAAHRFFHQYSLSNRWLASSQLRAQGMPLTPINTFKGWLSAKRPVQKGEKASIALIMPVPIKKKKAEGDVDGEDKIAFTKFMLRTGWFHLGQTDGDEYIVEEKSDGDWNMAAAMDFLEVSEKPFEFSGVHDIRLGYAIGKAIAVSPLEEYPTYGRIRQLSKIVLGHTADTPAKSVPEDPALREIEAETAAYLCCATLGFAGMEVSRVFLQDWLASSPRRIPDKSAQRAFGCADKILNAGMC